jgi:hypothetical protein
MRITIDITEAEERSATIRPETGSVLVTGSAGAEEAPPKDGGPPPEALLVALGAESATRAGGGPTERLGTDAGGPPAWLVDVVSGGADRTA